jgi:hypothetical protein
MYLTSYMLLLLLCNYKVTSPFLPFQDLISSLHLHHLRSVPIPYCTVLSRIKVPQLYPPFLRSTLFFKGSTEGVRYSLNPHKWIVVHIWGRWLQVYYRIDHVTADWATISEATWLVIPAARNFKLIRPALISFDGETCTQEHRGRLNLPLNFRSSNMHTVIAKPTKYQITLEN